MDKYNKRNLEEELIDDWCALMHTTYDEYYEPLATEEDIYFLKMCCDTFQVDIYVFILSLEILEKYYRICYVNNIAVIDRSLAGGIAFLTANKCTGAEIYIKVPNICDYLNFRKKNIYNQNLIRQAELHVLKTINGNIPITTKVEDLMIVLEKFLRQSYLNIDLVNISLKVLEMIYMLRHKWFFNLRNHYKCTSETILIFRNLMKNKFYLPIGILVTSIKLIGIQHILDIQNVINDLSQQGHIEEIHIEILLDNLSNIIMKFFPIMNFNKLV